MIYDDVGLYGLLGSLGIEYSLVSHVPLRTVLDSRSLRGDIGGLHVRNMFLRDKRRRYWLLTVEESSLVDLKALRRLLGASGSLSFADEGVLWDLLGVRAGAVTPFGVINDSGGVVELLLDYRLFVGDEIVNVHPLRNDRSLGILGSDLLRFLSIHHKVPKFIDFECMEFVD